MEIEHTWILHTNEDVQKIVTWEGKTIESGRLIAMDEFGVRIVDIDGLVTGVSNDTCTFFRSIDDEPFDTAATVGRWEMTVKVTGRGRVLIGQGDVVIKKGLGT